MKTLSFYKLLWIALILVGSDLYAQSIESETKQKVAKKLPAKKVESNTAKTDASRLLAPQSPESKPGVTEEFSFDRQNVKIDRNKPLTMEYQFKSWNKNPAEPDVAALLVRDGNSGKIAKIELNETAENSGVFRGSFGLSWDTGAEIIPEIYNAPLEMIKTPEQLKKVYQMMKDGSIARKPFFMKSDRRSQAITVYETKEQALEAQNQFRKNLQGKQIVDQAALEAQRRAQMLAEQARLAELAKLQEEQRLKMEQDEKRKQEELKKQQAALDAAERARRKVEAKKIAEEALALYGQGKFLEAEKIFEKATALDPENTSLYFKYGVTLYRLDKFNKSIVILELAEGKDVNKVERDYFIALNHMKLKEYDTAYKEFQDLKKSNDAAIAPSSAFFAGVIDFQKERYDDAKTNFEYTLDKGNDPTMDSQAEAYIEQIAAIKAFEAEKKKVFIFTATIGLTYDSNITTASNTQIDQGTATGYEGYRVMYGGSIEWRPIYKMAHEWSSKIAVNDMYSVDKNFKASELLQNTDPLVTSITAPYKYKGMMFAKAYQMTLTPGFDMINLNASATSDGVGNREVVSNSSYGKWDNTFIINDDWFSTISLEYRSDVNKIDATLNTVNDNTATKTTVSTSNTFFTDKKKTTAWIAELGYSDNKAAGTEQTYNRIDLGLTYMMPVFKDSAFTTKLGYYTANYSTHSTGRRDDDIGLTLGLSKPISQSLSAVFSGNYTINNSTNDSNAYKKYSVMSMLAWNGSL